MATQYKVKVKEGLENITSSLTGSWKGIYTCKTASGYEPFSNLYAMFNMTIYEQSGGLYANLDSPLLEKCSDVEIITIGDATLTITGIEPHYGGKLTLSFIGFSIDSFSGSVVFSLSNVEVGTGSCSLSRNETNIIPDTPSIDFTSNQEFDQNTSKKTSPNSQKHKEEKTKKPVLSYILIIVGIIVSINFISNLFHFFTDTEKTTQYKLSTAEKEAVMHFDKFLDDLHYISERVENKKIKNVSELSTMITTIDRNLNHVYDKRYDSHWEIKKYYEKIYPHLKKLHAFIQNNKTVIIDSFDIAVATNNDATVMTRLMNLSIYEDTTNSPISNSEADAIISLTEDLFLSEIRTYISELHYHITPIIDEDTPDIYDDIIYQ